MTPELTIPNLFARRSIRKFTDESVTEEQVQTLLEAGMAAPSASNRQPWHFIVVTEQETRAALADAHPYGKMVAQAPLCIVPCGDPSISEGYWVQDVSAATENILLAVVGLDLGAVWCGVHPRPERVAAVRSILGLPEDIIPFALLAIGNADEEKEPRTQYDEERVHRERW